MFDPKYPGPNAGEISPRTIVLRGPIPLTADQRKRAKSLRSQGWDWPDIAVELGRSEQDIRHALANVRMRHSVPERATANISIAARDQLRSLQLPGEVMWQTVNRLLNI